MKKCTRRLVRAAAILALATTTLFAAPGRATSGGQQPTTPAKPGNQGPGQPAGKPQDEAQTDDSGKPQFRARVDLITTDVIVRDSTGQFVADLKKSDFEVFEDGVK